MILHQRDLSQKKNIYIYIWDGEVDLAHSNKILPQTVGGWLKVEISGRYTLQICLCVL